MNTRQKIKLNMYLATRNFVNQNIQVTTTIPRFAENYNKLLPVIEEIQNLSEIQGINKTGVTIDKNRIKENLIRLADRASRKIAAYARHCNNDTLRKEIENSESSLKQLAEVTLRDRAQIIYDRAQENIEKLSQDGITSETQKELHDAIILFNNSLSTPRTGVAERKMASDRIPVLFDSADQILELMDYAVNGVKEEKPDFFNGYRTSRRIVDFNAGLLAVKASSVDSSTGEPLNGVTFSFNKKGEKSPSVVKKSSEKGNFQIRNLAEGSYSVTVSKPGFKTKVITVNVTSGERSDVRVELERE